MPHGHQDALGVYAACRGRVLLALPSTLETGGAAWRVYFHGPAAHNTVQVDDRAQRPTSRLPPGRAVRFVESTKVRRAIAAARLDGAATRLRGRLGLDPLPPRLRSQPRDGRLLGSGSDAAADWVSACHDTVEGVTHRRDTVRLGGSCLLVRDVVAGAAARIRQTWHFAPAADVRLEGAAGTIALDGAGGAIDARFVQLCGVPPRLLRGSADGADRAGWYAAGPGDPVPCCTLRYEAAGPQAEFVWLLALGEAPLAARRAADGAVRVATRAGDFQVGFSDVGVEVRRG
jgi:hypothetical protein